MTSSTVVHHRPVTYQDVSPLDWFQLRSFLWEGLADWSTDHPQRWSQIAQQVNRACPDSAPRSPEVFHGIYQRLTEAMPEVREVATKPGLGIRLWTRILYNSAQALFGAPPVFMNLGFVGLGDGAPGAPDLQPEDEPFRLNIQLYECLIGGSDLTGKDVLEVGCGTGGGCSYMHRYRAPATVTGIDLVDDNIRACEALHGSEGMTFLQGDALSLPVPSDSFDALVNLESSGCYPSMDSFLAEVRRVLRPGGEFLFADLRPTAEEWGPDRTLDGLRHQLADSGLEVLQERNITANVLASIDLQEEARQGALEALGVVGADRLHFDEIMLCHGSHNYRKLKTGELQYWNFTCRSPASEEVP
ncbi:MAG: class I SAM-dependent methyltransferase [Acidobacteriota bacterium]